MNDFSFSEGSLAGVPVQGPAREALTPQVSVEDSSKDAVDLFHDELESRNLENVLNPSGPQLGLEDGGVEPGMRAGVAADVVETPLKNEEWPEVPEIEGKTDFADALRVHGEMADSPARVELEEKINGFRRRLMDRGFMDPAVKLELERSSEKLARMDALSMDWMEHPEARQKAVEAYGEEWVKAFENVPDERKDLVRGSTLLEEIYSRPGDKEGDARMRLFSSLSQEELNGIRDDADIWRRFALERSAFWKEQEMRKAAMEKFSQDLQPVLENYVKGAPAYLPPDSMNMLSESGISWQSLRKARMGYEAVEAYTRGCRLFDDQVISRLAVCVGDDETTRQMLLNLLYNDSRRLAHTKFNQFKSENDDHSSGFLESAIARGKRSFESGWRNLEHLGEAEAASSVATRMPDKIAAGLSPDEARKEIEQDRAFLEIKRRWENDLVQTMEAAEEDYLNGPDRNILQHVASKVGGIVGDTSSYLLPYGGILKTASLGRWAGVARLGGSAMKFSVAGGAAMQSRRGEGTALGLDMLEAEQRAGLFGTMDFLEEMIAFGSVGKLVPGFERVRKWAGGKKVMQKVALGASPWRARLMSSPTAQAIAHTVMGIGEEAFVEPTAGFIMRSLGNTMLNDPRGMETLAGYVQGLEEMLAPKQLAALAIFSGGMSSLNYGEFKKDSAKFRDTLAFWKDAGGTEAGLQEAMKQPDIKSRIFKAAEIIRASKNETQEQQLQTASKAFRSMEDFSWLSRTEAYQAEVELLNLPRVEDLGDGNWRFTTTIRDAEGKESCDVLDLNEQDATARMQALLHDGVRMRMLEAQQVFAVDKTIDQLESSGKYVFEDMGRAETVETARKLAEAARLRIAEGADVNAGASDLGTRMTYGQAASMDETFKGRVDLGVERGEVFSVERAHSNAYRVAMRNGQTLIRFHKGEVTVPELLEEVLETHLTEDMGNTKHSMEWYAANLRALQDALQKEGYLGKGKELIRRDGEATMKDVIEGMSMLAKGDVLARAADMRLPQWMKDFLQMVRQWVSSAKALLDLGTGLHEMERRRLAGESVPIDADFAQTVYALSNNLESYWMQEGARQGEAAVEQIVKEVTGSGVSMSLSGDSSVSFSIVSIPSEDVVDTAADMRAKLKPLQGKVFVNKNTGIQAVIEARVSGKTVGKAQQAQMSIANLKALGFSAEDARKIHYTAATRIHELFENAEDGRFEEEYKDDPSRAGAYHFFNMVDIEEIGSFDVNVTALALKNEDQKLLYTLELTIENPKGVSVAYPSPDDQGDAYSASRVSTRNLSSYRSFVEKEKASIKRKAVADGTFMKAPNEADTRLTEDQWLTVRTNAFKNWFGDWEHDPANASKVVDDNGEPLVVYHGAKSGSGFTVFDTWGEGDSEGSGSFFSADRQVASGYANGEVYATFLNIRHPLVHDFGGSRWDSVPGRPSGYFVETEDGESEWFDNKPDADDALARYGEGAQIVEDYADDGSESNFTLNDLAREAREEGYDGVIAREVFDPSIKADEGGHAVSDDFVAFASNQIKSATDNRGTFDPSNPDITFSIIGEKAETWGKYADRVFAGRDDGKLRAEIDASQASLNAPEGFPFLSMFDEWSKGMGYRKNPVWRGRLEDVLNFDELYEAYPSLRNMYVFAYKNKNDSTRGYYDPEERSIAINLAHIGPIGAQLSTVLHEVQHAIQEFEGFAKGTNSSEVGGFEGYLRSAGEIESRNVETRHLWSQERRGAELFNKTLEYPGEAVVTLSLSEDSPLSVSRGTQNMEVVHRIAADLRADAATWGRYAGKTDEAAFMVNVGRNVSLVKSALMHLPAGYRVAVKPYIDRLQMLAELAAKGKIDETKLINTFARREIKREMADATREDVEDAEIVAKTTAAGVAWENGKKPTQKLAKEVFEDEMEKVRKAWAENRLHELMAEVMEKTAVKLEALAKDGISAGIAKMLDKVLKVRKKNGKQQKGKISAEAYTYLTEQVVPILRMTAEEKEAAMNEAEAELKKLEKENPDQMDGEVAARVEELDEELTRLSLYGNLEGMSVDEAETAAKAIETFIRTEKEQWAAAQEAAAERLNAIGRKIVDVFNQTGKKADENTLRAANEKFSGKVSYKDVGDFMENMDQLLTRMGAMPALKEFTEQMRDRLTNAFQQMRDSRGMRAAAVQVLYEKHITEKVMKARKVRNLAGWATWFKTSHDTGVKLSGWVSQTAQLTLEQAREVREMDARQRKEFIRKRWEEGMEYFSEETLDILLARLKEYEEAAARAKDAGKRAPYRKYVTAKVSFQGEESSPLVMSRDNALQVVLLSEQESYREMMKQQGYTPEVIASLRKYVGEEGMAIGYGLREMLKVQGDKIGKLYEQVTGVPFPREMNYYPARFWALDAMSDADAADMISGVPSTKGGNKAWQHVRTKHHRRLDTSVGALSVFWEATDITDHWYYTQDITTDFRGLLKRREVAESLVANLGKDDFVRLRRWVDLLERAGVVQGQAVGSVDKLMNAVYSGQAKAILAFRFETLLKQGSAVLNAWIGDPSIGLTDYLFTMTKMRNNTAEMGVIKMLKSPEFQARLNGKMDVEVLSRLKDDSSYTLAEAALVFGMNGIEYTDAFFNAVGSAALWNIKYRQALKSGMEEGAAKDEAWQAVRNALHSAQPQTWIDKSFGGLHRGTWGRVIFYMMSENFNKTAAIYGLARMGFTKGATPRQRWASLSKAGKVWLAYGAFNAIIGAMLDYMKDDEDEWEKRDWYGYLLAAIAGPVAGMPLAGEAVEWLCSVAGLKVYTGSAGRALIDIRSGWNAGAKLWDMMQEGDHEFQEYMMQVIRLGRVFGAAGGIASGTANKTVQAVGQYMTLGAALMNPVKTVADVVD